MNAHSLTMVGTGLIGDFYTMTLHGQRRADRVRVAYSRTAARGRAFGERWSIPESTTDMAAAIRSVEDGALGDVTWVRSRGTNPDPHSAWFWDGRLTGGGAIIDLGCHWVEIIRNFVGKGNRPVSVMRTTDTLAHPIDAEGNAIALIKFESGAIGQFEVPTRVPGR